MTFTRLVLLIILVLVLATDGGTGLVFSIAMASLPILVIASLIRWVFRSKNG